MLKKTSEKNAPTQSQIFELLGRALYVCNFIELRLRWMHKYSGGFWTSETPEELLSKVKKIVERQLKENRAPLGPIGQEMLEAIYTPRSNEDIEAAEKKHLFVFKLDYKVEGKNRFRRAKIKFEKFVDTRNYLVHYFARDYDLTNEESRKKAYADLKNKCVVIKNALEFFNEDYEMMQDALRSFQKQMGERNYSR